MVAKMKYYIYISDAKVDMLYSQIDKSLLKKIASELSIDIKPGGIGIGGTFKPNPVKETRISKLRLVVKYIEKHHKVGWIDAPEDYFKGSLPMYWRSVNSEDAANRRQPYAVSFIGKTDRTKVGLVGSVRYMIGNVADAPTKILYHSTHTILQALASTTERPVSVDKNDLLKIVDELFTRISEDDLRQQRPLEFLARNYSFEQKQGLNLLLGSPIYVAFAD